MAIANSEQIKAIEHQGGVLLKAGAGSGKTFVLKEHVIYLAKLWISNSKEKSESLEEFEIEIRSHFRKIILMTFTKKAAGELNIRLNQEFKLMQEESSDLNDYWEILVQNLSYLNVSTIHGFCFKLINMGFFPAISAEQVILTDSEFTDTIYDIFDTYLSNQLSSKSNEEFIQYILKDKKQVFDSIKGIFSDPTLRLSWKNLETPSKDDKELNETIINIVEDLNFTELFNSSENFESLTDYQGKKWFDFINLFNKKAIETSLSYAGLLSFYEFFKAIEFKIPAKPSIKTVDPDIVSYYEKVRDLKDYLKKNGEDFSQFSECFDSHVVPWFKLIKEFIDHIEIEYSKTEGVTFSDLEYIVYENLQNDEVAKRVQSEFEYFIVDEFQDTSFIQYSILEKLIGENFDKLFCVGDLKQAIYGFRGGELGVFLDCEKKIPQNLSLRNNYRSDKNIINFNNHFFEDIFKKGTKFKGIDIHAVDVESQAVPDSTSDEGSIVELESDLSFVESGEKLSNLEVDYFEALVLRDKIKNYHASGESVAILYKRLKPSLILINLLMQEEIGFVAQTKVPFLEDPIIGIFYSLLARQFDQSATADDYRHLLIETYLNILNGKQFEFNLKEELELFDESINYFGLYSSFSTFLENLGLCNSKYSENLLFIKMMIKSCANDTEAIYKSFTKKRETSYSLDFHYGENSNQIQLMSAHGSKGLQFKNVFLGGIYTNENSYMFTSIIGKYPFSFKWAKNIIGKEKFKTPYYILEEQVTKKKDFSENKRLFYVANTRAESTLNWVKLRFGELKRSKNQYSAWSKGFESWFESNNSFTNINTEEIDISKYYSDKFLSKLENTAPFFHRDSMGIEFMQNPKAKYLLSELSVTRFASIVECPRKFYFQNICKLSSEEMDLLDSPHQVISTLADNDELNSSSFKSSAARGTLIHEKISSLILEQFSQASINEIDQDKENLLWLVEKLKVYLNKSILLSEKPIKFEVFGYMISGIPDLIVQPLPDTGEWEIWDFKTGHYSEDKLTAYDFQLYVYAYSQYISGHVSKDRPIKLVLSFLDEQKLVERNVLFTDVEKYLQLHIQKLNQPWLKNEKSCEFCSYKTICQK